MGAPVFWNGTLLFSNAGLLAMDPACCCDQTGSCCCQLSAETLTATISAPDCTAAIDGKIVTLNPAIAVPSDPICESHLGMTNSGLCTSAVFSITIALRCNRNLADRGGGSTDYYEMMIQYGSSACTDLTDVWRRVESGSLCSPLSLVFKVPPPSWSGNPPEDCDCCTTTDDITVTITI